MAWKKDALQTIDIWIDGHSIIIQY